MTRVAIHSLGSPSWISSDQTDAVRFYACSTTAMAPLCLITCLIRKRATWFSFSTRSRVCFVLLLPCAPLLYGSPRDLRVRVRFLSAHLRSCRFLHTSLPLLCWPSCATSPTALLLSTRSKVRALIPLSCLPCRTSLTASIDAALGRQVAEMWPARRSRTTAACSTYESSRVSTRSCGDMSQTLSRSCSR